MIESTKDKPSNPPITPPLPLPPDPRLRDKEERGKPKPKEVNVKMLIKTEGNL